MSIVKAFNNHFIEFLDDVLNVFPNDKNIKTAKYYISGIMKINPSIVVKAWHEYVVLPYSKQINDSDWSFFMRKDYEKDIGTSEQYNSEKVLGAIELIRDKASKMSDNDQEKIIKYIQNLSKLSIMYKQ
jgi:hypothetical protein